MKAGPTLAAFNEPILIDSLAKAGKDRGTSAMRAQMTICGTAKARRCRQRKISMIKKVLPAAIPPWAHHPGGRGSEQVLYHVACASWVLRPSTRARDEEAQGEVKAR